MRLTMKQRQAVTAVTVQRYRNGSKKMKQQILDEFCESTGYCRGYARFVLRNHVGEFGCQSAPDQLNNCLLLPVNVS